MTQRPSPVFLERQSYRRRRLGDAASLLVVLGVVLVLLPVLWSASAETSGGLIYLFLVWALLIAGAALLARKLSDEGMNSPEDMSAVTKDED